ncbi:putative RNA polymerase II mediator complex component SRB4 [Talaromyces proteolyticus]|uniref:Mediator of RNA polymerase II transcription subunit 17 n=1 Tax=Talaromyces proteolyticus TaxID=1131652 RepID=A0AAD4KJX1_9EURO|nr:putative RNA polymerase II mediator complex component SRB4 [Talaromyces proteolyticus]KAH8689974.1 putative RNA polymerase II mediator complex component SRB4 [Talaromyces proteolyticus]
MEQGSSLTLPLRAQVNSGTKTDNLPTRIAQINAQRGSFRNVTEQSLEDEIAALKQKRKEIRDGQDEGEEACEQTADLDATERHELLYKRRAEIAQFAAQAHMEVQFALDFVSLLLSKYTPRQAEQTISPYLKQNLPTGSLNVDVVKAPQKSESSRRDAQTVARGWKLESFKSSANKLLKVASRLDSEVAAETKYWDQVLAIKEKGWKVCRLPRERQALGVQYGFLEATPVFRDRGLASLRRADDGTLILDKGLVPIRSKAVRVRVRKEGKITGRSDLSQFVAAAATEDSIEKTILQARDTLFEEELFHELNREARALSSSGVTTHRNLIEFEYDEGEHILLDLVDLADIPKETEPTEPTAQCGAIAEATAHSLRILLSYAHRQNLRRRTQFPPPLTNQKRPTPQYQLLRPILSYLQHDAHVRSLQEFLYDIYQVLKAAGLPSEYTGSAFSSLKFNTKPQHQHLQLPAVETLVSQFLEPLESRFSGTMANQSSTFNIRIHTNTGTETNPNQRLATTTSTIGTEYELSIRLPNFPYTQPPSRIGVKKEVESFLLHLLTLDLTTYFTSISPQNTTPSNPPLSLSWESPFPHHGEVIGVKPNDETNRASKQLWIEIKRDALILRILSDIDKSFDNNDEGERKEEISKFVDGEGVFRYTRPDRRAAHAKLLYEWRLGGDNEPRKTLKDVIGEISRCD